MSVGDRRPRIDAGDKVTGAAAFPAERIPPDALWAKVVFSGQPHARLITLDTAPAFAVPGVIAVLTAADVPVNEYGLTMFDQPVLVGASNGRSEVVSDVSRWEADQIAVVVATDRDSAAAGAAALRTEWDPLPVVADLDAALTGNVLVHPESGSTSNIYCSLKIRKGDPDAGFAAADVIVDGTYEVPYQEHAYLQPEAAVSYIDDKGRVTVEVAGQWTQEDREQIAHALDLPLDRVRVVYPAIGGAFGGREDMSVQIVMALAAQQLAAEAQRRPIVTMWSREESIVGHHKRHRGRIHTRWGVTADGRITAVEATVILDAGAYNYTTNKVLGNAHLSVVGPYEIPNARIDSHAVYTNAPPGGAFRGFGAPQGIFAAECQMNRLAERLGLDAVEIRRRNVLSDGSIGICQTSMPAGVTMPQVLENCAMTAGWDQPLSEAKPFSPFASLLPQNTSLRRGRGIACALKNVGFSFGFPERCDAMIVLHGEGEAPDRAEVFHGGADVGQGAHTVFLQMAAEATGVPVDRVTGTFSDTATSGDSGSASASRLTWMAGNSILGAAEEADKAWRNGDRPAVGAFRFIPPPTEPLEPDTGYSTPNFTYGYAAQVVELTVDVETGHIVVDRVVSTHDVGRAINRTLVEGQIEGAVVQGHGYAISENLQVAGGKILNPRLSQYLIPGIGDIPRSVISDVLELADPLGPWGARGMAEMPLIPYAAAVVSALHDATGIWYDRFPLSPDRVRAALRDAVPVAAGG